MKNYIFSLLLVVAFSSTSPLFAPPEDGDEVGPNCFLVKFSNKGHEGQFVVTEGDPDKQ